MLKLFISLFGKWLLFRHEFQSSVPENQVREPWQSTNLYYIRSLTPPLVKVETYRPKLKLLLEKTLEMIQLGLSTRGIRPPDPSPTGSLWKGSCNQNSFIFLFYRLSFEQIQPIKQSVFNDLVQSICFSSMRKRAQGPK